MAEVKNSFLQSKMNKDLDDRLIPNSQYRDALNIEVGKSENDSIGTLQNVLGNSALNNLRFDEEGLTCIGMFMDNQNNRIYQFLTNYTDPIPSNITLCKDVTPPFDGWVMKITVYDYNVVPPYKTIVSGTFLNFSTTNSIIGVNLLEGLLFWTDNRNQPRKINVNSAFNNPSYYTDEVQISVAKYAPVEPISLLKRATGIFDTIHAGSYQLVLGSVVGNIEVGMTVVSPTLPGSDYMYVTEVINTPEENSFKLFTDPTGTSTISPGDQLTFLSSTMSNKSSDPDWPGDPAYLEDKYVRFSYRFKFDDNEYSLMAPFTQIAYIPKQKGFFLNGDEFSAYKSTVIKWMENNVDNIELLIPMPDTGSNINTSYKITQLDILYKESDALAVKVLDSITITEIQQNFPNTNIYNYPYQSQKPFKTLPEDQTTRVYDIVPTRALAQEVVGNRVVYGNFYNTYNAPLNINYNTKVLPKSSIFTNFVEYPNHTLKQNRNYQVGFVLADKFGRESSVILSTADLNGQLLNGTVYGGSTVYAPYQSEESMAGMPDVIDWFGNAIVLLVNNTIDSTRNIPSGTPGLYAIPTSTTGFTLDPGFTATIVGNIYTYRISTAGGVVNAIPVVGEKMRGAFKDYVTIIPNDPDIIYPNPTITTDGQINDLYLSNYISNINGVPDIKFAYNINDIGWYSYKVVVKQQQQEYYNVYLPGMLNGYPGDQTVGSQVSYTGGDLANEPVLQNGINTTDFPVGEEGKTSHIVLINDNINKVPRDLVEVGPDQKLYRSSVSLYGKVQNTYSTSTVLSIVPVVNLFANSIKYLISANPDTLIDVKVGDSIQSDEANTDISPGVKNPDAWYANTVVTSNAHYTFTNKTDSSVVGVGSTTITLATLPPPIPPDPDDVISYTIDNITYYHEVVTYIGYVITLSPPVPVAIPASTILTFTNPYYGVITFSPTNVVKTTYINYAITGAENIQYYPTRKADIVSAIATAADFNFLENGVNNVKGTAALNFYQLQTKPSIGRVEVVNPIGVINTKMIPFLSVYETTPTTSELALFWETTSTGYISDLNYDVLTGFDGPVGLSSFDFLFYEDQNYDGISPDGPGDVASKWITSNFVTLSNTGVPLTPISITLDSVFNNSTDGSRVDFKNQFLVELDPDTTNEYRLGITTGFWFEHTSLIDSAFTFNIKVIWQDGEPPVLFQIQGSLRNRAPYFLLHSGELTITPTEVISYPTNAKNGSFLEVKDQVGLYWDIISGNIDNYFSIDSATGIITRNTLVTSIPVGIYTLEIRVRDAMGGIPIAPLIGPEEWYSTLSDTRSMTFTVIEPRVNNNLQYYDTGAFVSNIPNTAYFSCTPVIGQGYAAVHIGEEDLSLDALGINTSLPDIRTTIPAASSPAFMNYVNVAIENGAVVGSLTNAPKGLTQGALEWEVKNTAIRVPTGGGVEVREGRVQFILWWRASKNNTWVPIRDENNVWNDPSGKEWITSEPYSDLYVKARNNQLNNGPLSSKRSTFFITSIPGEYCLTLKYTYNQQATGVVQTNDCGINFQGSVIVKDANYSYASTTPPFGGGVRISYPYRVSLVLHYDLDYPSGIPYGGPTAIPGFVWNKNVTVAEDYVVNSVTIRMESLNSQIVPGVFLQSNIYFDSDTQVVSVNTTAKTLTFSNLSLIPIPTGTIFNLETRGSDTGVVYATTKNGLHVRQFYKDEPLTIPWIPPIPDKFYIYRNQNRNYNIEIGTMSFPEMLPITDKPYFTARFNADGSVYSYSAAPFHTVTTAYTDNTIFNPIRDCTRNLFQEIIYPL